MNRYTVDPNIPPPTSSSTRTTTTPRTRRSMSLNYLQQHEQQQHQQQCLPTNQVVVVVQQQQQQQGTTNNSNNNNSTTTSTTGSTSPRNRFHATMNRFQNGKFRRRSSGSSSSNNSHNNNNSTNQYGGGCNDNVGLGQQQRQKHHNENDNNNNNEGREEKVTVVVDKDHCLAMNVGCFNNRKNKWIKKSQQYPLNHNPSQQVEEDVEDNKKDDHELYDRMRGNNNNLSQRNHDSISCTNITKTLLTKAPTSTTTNSSTSTSVRSYKNNMQQQQQHFSSSPLPPPPKSLVQRRIQELGKVLMKEEEVAAIAAAAAATATVLSDKNRYVVKGVKQQQQMENDDARNSNVSILMTTTTTTTNDDTRNDDESSSNSNSNNHDHIRKTTTITSTTTHSLSNNTGGIKSLNFVRTPQQPLVTPQQEQQHQQQQTPMAVRTYKLPTPKRLSPQRLAFIKNATSCYQDTTITTSTTTKTKINTEQRKHCFSNHNNNNSGTIKGTPTTTLTSKVQSNRMELDTVPPKQQQQQESKHPPSANSGGIHGCTSNRPVADNDKVKHMNNLGGGGGNDNEITNKKGEILILISTLSLQREVSVNQNQAYTILTAHHVPYKVIDGADPINRTIRNELFTIRNNNATYQQQQQQQQQMTSYPQFFYQLLESDTTTASNNSNSSNTKKQPSVMYWGDYEKLQWMNENGRIEQEFLGTTSTQKKENVAGGVRGGVGIPVPSTTRTTTTTVTNSQNTTCGKKKKQTQNVLMIVLVSNQSLKREVSIQQDRALLILKTQKQQLQQQQQNMDDHDNDLHYILIDGADPKNRTIRNQLFTLSQRVGQYPQFFVTTTRATTITAVENNDDDDDDVSTADGTKFVESLLSVQQQEQLTSSSPPSPVLVYWGDYEKLEYCNEMGTIRTELQQQLQPSNVSSSLLPISKDQSMKGSSLCSKNLLDINDVEKGTGGCSTTTSPTSSNSSRTSMGSTGSTHTSSSSSIAHSPQQNVHHHPSSIPNVYCKDPVQQSSPSPTPPTALVITSTLPNSTANNITKVNKKTDDVEVLVPAVKSTTKIQMSILLLISKQTLKRSVLQQQEDACRILDTSNIPYEIIDGSDYHNTKRRNHLMILSGFKNIYPQLFVLFPNKNDDDYGANKKNSSTTMYWGTYQRLLECYNTNATNKDGDGDEYNPLYHHFFSGCTTRP